MCDKKWVEVNDLSSGQYSVNKNITFKTSMLRSDLCDYRDSYIVVRGATGFLAQKNAAFKNNAPFRPCVSKIDSV